MLDLLADRFKIEAIARHAQEREGATSAQDVIQFMSQIATEAAQRYPKFHFLDGLYKVLQSRG